MSAATADAAERASIFEVELELGGWPPDRAHVRVELHLQPGYLWQPAIVVPGRVGTLSREILPPLTSLEL